MLQYICAAQFLGIRSPLPYALRKYAKKSKLENGMNFAYGGTGVFDTLVSGPNLTTQIGFFQHLLEQEKVYDKRDLIKSSVALVSVAGNDYTTHFVKPGNGSKVSGGSASFIYIVSKVFVSFGPLVIQL